MQKSTVSPPYEVIVTGGGVAGVAAALAARRLGSRVLLLEKSCTLGGLATAGLVNLFVPMCNGAGIPILRGMAEEFLRDSIRYGFDSLNEPWKAGVPQAPTKWRYATSFAAPVFALQLVERLRNEGVEMLMDATVADVRMNGGVCEGLEVLCEEGMRFIPAQMIVDASGGSVIFSRAGAETILGNNYFSYHAHGITLDSCREAVEKRNIRFALRWQRGGDADLYGRRHPENMPFFHGDTSRNVTDYLVANQLCMLDKVKQQERLHNLPIALPGMPQLRTVRRIAGAYTLTEGDLFRHFEDSVTACCDSERRGALYEIPYRTLYHRDFANMIAAGRNISAAGYLWDVTRVIPPAIVTGQAAGTAAALAVRENCSIPELKIAPLQQLLRDQQVLIHFNDAWIPPDRKAGEYSPASHSSPECYVKEAQKQTEKEAGK